MRFACMLSLTVLFVAFLFSSVFAQEPAAPQEQIKYVVVKKPFPNVYEKLDPKSAIIQKVKQGDFLELLSEGESWFKVKVGDKEGYLERKAGKVVDKKGASVVTIILYSLVLLGCAFGVYYYFKRQKAILAN